MTISFPRQVFSLERSRRFEYNSIYYKDDPFKQKKKVDEFMFPRDLLNNFRNSIREASKSQSKEILKPRRGKNTIENEEI